MFKKFITETVTRGNIAKEIKGYEVFLKTLYNLDIKELKKLLQNNTLSEDSRDIIKAIINIKQGKIK